MQQYSHVLGKAFCAALVSALFCSVYGVPSGIIPEHCFQNAEAFNLEDFHVRVELGGRFGEAEVSGVYRVMLLIFLLSC